MKKSRFKFQRMIRICMALALLINLHALTYANSGPTIMEEYPSSEMIVDEANAIIVNHETLTFDLTSDLYSEGAKVKATYEMENTSDETQNVHMVFPLVSTIKSLEDHVEIQCDGEPISLKKIYLDKVNTPNNLPDFETVLKQATEQDSFLTSDLICYEFIPQVDLAEMQIEVKFSLSDPQSLIFVQNINSYGYDGNRFSIGGWFGKNVGTDETLKLYLTKGEVEALEYTVKEKSSDNPIDSKTGFENLKVEQTTISNANMKALLENQLFSEESDIYTKTDKEKMLNEALHELYEPNDMPILILDDLTQYLYRERIILLSYDIAFKPVQKREITVAYQMKGTFDKRNSSEPTYTFEYFLKPASYWKAFDQLDLTINLKAPYEYILSSSLPLTRKSSENQISYHANFDQLPEEDLTFTVYTSETITALDQLKGKWSRTYVYVFFLMVLPLIFVVAVVVGIVFIVKKIK
ncbi:hypothetical protein [Fusibacter sp. 3D3]|uniref:hypothetical protein n=1 Tax=Fusibacter sp. 3D3 TaxID=1048380 RepID=UPI00085316BC|nr:hypothetical protein [Fusibacter sp. 3D3]GAU79150.1 hypothetical protein F3D3_3788 [Fusibacter sp. 3D3]